MSVFVYAHMFEGPWWPEEGVRFSGAGVTGVFELLSVGVCYGSQGLCKEQYVLFTTDPLVQPPSSLNFYLTCNIYVSVNMHAWRHQRSKESVDLELELNSCPWKEQQVL